MGEQMLFKKIINGVRFKVFWCVIYVINFIVALISQNDASKQFALFFMLIWGIHPCLGLLSINTISDKGLIILGNILPIYLYWILLIYCIPINILNTSISGIVNVISPIVNILLP